MYFDRVQAKTQAKATLREAKPSPMVVTLALWVLTSGISLVVERFLSNPFRDIVQYIAMGYDPVEVLPHVLSGGRWMVVVFVSVLLTLYSTVMQFGYQGYLLSLSRREEAGYGSLLSGFNMAAKVIWLDIVTSFYIMLWAMLFIIPGIIAAYRYSQAVRCLIDDPDIGALEAIRRSKEMMRGEKFNLFVLELSFLGWILLFSVIAAVPTMLVGGPGTDAGVVVQQVLTGLFSLWLTPYQGVVFSSFYNNLIGWGKPQEEQQPPTYRGPELEF